MEPPKQPEITDVAIAEQDPYAVEAVRQRAKMQEENEVAQRIQIELMKRIEKISRKKGISVKDLKMCADGVAKLSTAHSLKQKPQMILGTAVQPPEKKTGKSIRPPSSPVSIHIGQALVSSSVVEPKQLPP